MSGKKAFLIDIAHCCGCYNCQFACKDEHVDNDWRPYAAPQPNVGQFWLKLRDYERGTLPKVKLHYVPVMCAHCADAACISACTKGAVTRRDDGFVLIDPDVCDGCGSCVSACPVGAIYFNEQANIAQKCTGCAHLLDNGRTEPRCVGVCPTGALKFVDEDEIPAEAVSLVPESAGPRAWYLNMPGRFVAGAVYDPSVPCVIEGAVCALSDGGRAVTDAFGDFWLENAGEVSLKLTISAEGYKTTVLDIPAGTESVNLGDIALAK